jgi:outer membrane protein
MKTTKFLIGLLLWGTGLAIAGPWATAQEGLPATGAEAVTPVEQERRTLTLDEAIRLGIAQSPLIQASRYGVEETEAVTKQIESINYPQVRGVFTQTAGNTRILSNLGVSGSLPKQTNATSTVGGRVDYLITDFGRTAHRILSNKALTASAEKDVLTNKAVVILNIQQAYLTSLKQQRLVEIAEATLRQRQLIRDQAEAFYRNQLRAKLDLDLASVEVARAEAVVLRARNDLKSSLANLRYVMGGTDRDFLLIEVPLPEASPEITDPPLEALFKEGLEKRPELLASKDRIQAAEEALKAAQALNYGTIAAIGALGETYYQRPPYSGSVNGKTLGWYGAGVVSSTPIFSGFRIEGQIEEAQGRKNEAQASTRSIANDIVLQIAQAYLTRATAGQQIDVAQARADHARELLGLARERYKRGLGSILDVTVATVEVLNAETAVAETQYDYRASEVALAYARGAEYSRY